MKRAASVHFGLLVLLIASGAALAERMTHVRVTVQNTAKQNAALTMHDEHSGQTFVVSVPAGGKRTILLESSQSTDDCCGSVSWDSTDGSRNQHRSGLKNGDVVTVP